MPLVRKPIYPYTDFYFVDDIMSFSKVFLFLGVLNQESILVNLLSLILYIWGFFFHNIYPISHVHIVPIDRCAFLYALITNGSMCFPFLFIQTIVDISRSKSKG